MLPLLNAPSNEIGTIKHAMDTVAEITNFLNPSQRCVMAADQPLYALAKQIQWTWPEKYGAHKFLIMMGGLHIEMEFMKILGNLLDCSGWTHILAQSGVAGSGTAESFLNASNVKKNTLCTPCDCIMFVDPTTREL